MKGTKVPSKKTSGYLFGKKELDDQLGKLLLDYKTTSQASCPANPDKP